MDGAGAECARPRRGNQYARHACCTDGTCRTATGDEHAGSARACRTDACDFRTGACGRAVVRTGRSYRTGGNSAGGACGCSFRACGVTGART